MSRQFETIEYSQSDGVATVTLARPERLNAFDVTMTRELPRSQAIRMADVSVGLGTDPDALAEGQQRFASGGRVDWRTR